MPDRYSVKEGDIYKVINISGRSFEIRYGYYDECERTSWEPVPIFPNFEESPVYDENGYPFVTRTQDACENYISKNKNGDKWCADCIYYPAEKQEIGICRCSQNRRQGEKS